MKMCNYYQAHVQRSKVVEVVGILKSIEHVCFDRALDGDLSIFEFFVPYDQDDLFRAAIAYFESKGFVRDLVQLPNRLLHEPLVP